MVERGDYRGCAKTVSSIFLVLRLERTVDAALPGRVVTIPLTWAEGMTGAVAVFGSREDAERYAQGRYSIQEAIVEVENDGA